MKQLPCRMFILTAVVGAYLAEGRAESPVVDRSDNEVTEADIEAIRSGRSRFDWSWIAQKFDKDGDDAVSAAEFGGSFAEFQRLDASGDGDVTSADLDWSPDSPLTMQKETAFALFKAFDSDGDSRLSPDQWAAILQRYAGEKRYLTSEDLERLMFQPRRLKAQREQESAATRERMFRGRRVLKVPQPGDHAPDFTLSSADGRQTVQLSSYRGKQPVVLIFGCFSCGNYRIYSEPLEAMYRAYRDRAAFVRIYVTEAHPTDDGVVSEANAKAGIRIGQPTTLQERCAIASRCATTLNLETPLVVDEIDDRVGKAYGSWPDRLYLVDREGRIAYTGGPGPFAFNPRELEQSLILLLREEARIQQPAGSPGGEPTGR